MQQQPHAVIAVLRVVAAVVQHPHAVIIQAQGCGHRAVVQINKEQAQHAGAGSGGRHPAEKVFPFRGQELGFGRVAAAHQIQKGIHPRGGVIRFGDAVPAPVGVPFQAAQFAAQFVAVFLAQPGEIGVPVAGENIAGRHILLGDVHRVAPFLRHGGQHRQGGGILGDGIQLQAPAAVGADGVQQGGVEGGLLPGGDDEIVVVKGVAAAHQGVIAAAAGQRGDGGDVAGGIGLVEAGQTAPVAEGVPPHFLPVGGQIQVVDGGAAQQLPPLGANLLKGG